MKVAALIDESDDKVSLGIRVRVCVSLQGSWADDQRHGNGKYFYPNGDYYNGEWLKHERHGQGEYYYHDTGE